MHKVEENLSISNTPWINKCCPCLRSRGWNWFLEAGVLFHLIGIRNSGILVNMDKSLITTLLQDIICIAYRACDAASMH
jgi:hypothetical protein